jgi:SAM-dependent methyltransferase
MASDELSTDLDAFDQFEARAWEERVEGYAGFFGDITGRLIEPLLDLARVGPGTRVLDVATGPGYVAAEAARRGAAVWAVDVAEAMVARAAVEHSGIEFTRADAQSLSFDDGSFDAVVANFGLPHFGRPELAVAEGVRTLVAGGRLALTGRLTASPRAPMSSGSPTTKSFGASSKNRASSMWKCDAWHSRTKLIRSRTCGAPCNAGRFGWPRSSSVSPNRRGSVFARPSSIAWLPTAARGGSACRSR